MGTSPVVQSSSDDGSRIVHFISLNSSSRVQNKTHKKMTQNTLLTRMQKKQRANEKAQQKSLSRVSLFAFFFLLFFPVLAETISNRKKHKNDKVYITTHSSSLADKRKRACFFFSLSLFLLLLLLLLLYLSHSRCLNAKERARSFLLKAKFIIFLSCG